MKLYTNNRGDWAGTQADARKQFGKERRTIEVPTDKPNLMAFLNQNKVGSSVVQNTPEPDVQAQPEILSRHATSWVSWAMDKIKQGKKDEAMKMLRKGLEIQSAWVGGDKKDSGWVK